MTTNKSSSPPEITNLPTLELKDDIDTSTSTSISTSTLMEIDVDDDNFDENNNNNNNSNNSRSTNSTNSTNSIVDIYVDSDKSDSDVDDNNNNSNNKNNEAQNYQNDDYQTTTSIVGQTDFHNTVVSESLCISYNSNMTNNHHHQFLASTTMTPTNGSMNLDSDQNSTRLDAEILHKLENLKEPEPHILPRIYHSNRTDYSTNIVTENHATLPQADVNVNVEVTSPSTQPNSNLPEIDTSHTDHVDDFVEGIESSIQQKTNICTKQCGVCQICRRDTKCFNICVIL